MKNARGRLQRKECSCARRHSWNDASSADFAGAKEIYEAIEGFIGKRGQSEDEAVKIDALAENEVPSDKISKEKSEARDK